MQFERVTKVYTEKDSSGNVINDRLVEVVTHKIWKDRETTVTTLTKYTSTGLRVSSTEETVEKIIRSDQEPSTCCNCGDTLIKSEPVEGTGGYTVTLYYDKDGKLKGGSKEDKESFTGSFVGSKDPVIDVLNSLLDLKL